MTDLDSFDIRILMILAEEGRISWRELSERIGLSQTPTMRRVRILEERGYITGYRANIDEARLGQAFSVFVFVSLERQSEQALAEFEQRILELPEIMSCFMMTGDTDYMLRVLVPTLADFQAFVTRIIAGIPGVARINSSIAVKSVIRRDLPPLHKLANTAAGGPARSA